MRLLGRSTSRPAVVPGWNGVATSGETDEPRPVSATDDTARFEPKEAAPVAIPGHEIGPPLATSPRAAPVRAPPGRDQVEGCAADRLDGKTGGPPAAPATASFWIRLGQGLALVLLAVALHTWIDRAHASLELPDGPGPIAIQLTHDFPRPSLVANEPSGRPAWTLQPPGRPAPRPEADRLEHRPASSPARSEGAPADGRRSAAPMARLAAASPSPEEPGQHVISGNVDRDAAGQPIR